MDSYREKVDGTEKGTGRSIDESDRNILSREVARKIRWIPRLARVPASNGRLPGWYGGVGSGMRTPCNPLRGSGLTYERLVTPRFCGVDSNSSRHRRNRCGFKKRGGGGRGSDRRGTKGGRAATGRERQRGRGNGTGGAEGLTIACKSLDKRPGIVKTRRGRDSIFIS